MFALRRVVSTCVAQHHEAMRGSKVLIDIDNIDNMAAYGAFRRGKSSKQILHRLILSLFRLEVEGQLVLSLRWVCSAY